MASLGLFEGVVLLNSCVFFFIRCLKEFVSLLFFFCVTGFWDLTILHFFCVRCLKEFVLTPVFLLW